MKKTHKILLIVLLVSVVFGAFPMTARADEVDGDFWNGVLKDFEPATAKVILISYLRGYWDGIVFFSGVYGEGTLNPSADSYMYYFNQLTEWYKDPANRKIPAVIMLDLADGRFRGALSDQEIQQQFLELRKIIPAK